MASCMWMATATTRTELDLTDPDTKALTKGQIGQEVFHYTIEDNDGDKSSTTLKINVEGSNEPPKIDLDPQDPENDDETAVVSDEGLKGGNTDSDPVPTDETNLPTFTGQLVVSDPDLPADTLTVAMQSGAFPAWTFSDNQAVTWTLVNGHLLEGRTPDNLLALTVEITATATPNTYDYTVTLHQPLDHPINSIEDELQFGIQVRVTDSTGEVRRGEPDRPGRGRQAEDHAGRRVPVLGTDETVGGKGDFDDPSAVFPLDGGAFEGDEAAAGGVLAGLGTVIGFDSGNGAALFDHEAGADGEDSHAYGLKVVNGGLTTADRHGDRPRGSAGRCRRWRHRRPARWAATSWCWPSRSTPPPAPSRWRSIAPSITALTSRPATRTK